MARMRTCRSLRRRLHPARGEDPMSALPDDLLLLILRRLDARTALGTALLSRRWARLHRELLILDFRVGDMLPPRYHRLVLLHHDMNKNGYHLPYKKSVFMQKIKRYERCAMRALTRSVESFLDDEGARPSASVNRLRLEFFITHNPGCMNRLIAKSIDEWGVSDLEAVAKPICFQQSVVHNFPGLGLCRDPRASCLRSLRLGGCTLPPLHELSALTMLVLQDIAISTPTAAYEGVFTLCPQLRVLHLKSCECAWDADLVVDAPSSQIRELVFDKCRFGWVRMRALPNLESLASRGTLLHFESASFPRLRQCNHTNRVGIIRRRQYFGHRHELGSILGVRHMPGITNLVVRFTGPRRWVVPSSSPLSSPLLPRLTKLLVADVPSSWDVSWPLLLLLQMSPSLETLHIHIAPCTERPGRVIPWEKPTELRRRHLKEFVVAGFGGTNRQIYLVNFVVGVSTALRRVALFKKGHARAKGHWDWEMVTEQHSWTDDEKNATRKEISSPTAQLVFG